MMFCSISSSSGPSGFVLKVNLESPDRLVAVQPFEATFSKKRDF